MTAPEALTPAPFAYYRASSVSGNNLLDIGGGTGGTLTGATSSFGTTSTANGWGVAGKATAIGDGFSAYWTAGAAAQWTPLSSGSGATIALYFRPTTSGAPYIIFDTGGLDPTKDGVYVWYDPVLERIGLDFSRSAGSGKVIDWVNGSRFSWAKTCALGKPHVLVLTITASANPNIAVWLDGHLIDELNVDDRQRGTSALGTTPPDPEPRTFGTSTAGYALRVAAPISGGSPFFVGELVEFGFWSSVLSADNIELLWQWAESNYGLTMDRYAPGIVLWDGNSLTDNVWLAGQYPEVVTPQLRQRTFNLMRAIAGMELNQQVARVAKQVTPYADSSRPFRILVAWGDFVNQTANGGTKEACYASYVSYCQARQAEGWKVISATAPPWAFDSAHVVSDYLTSQIVANYTTFSDACARLDLVTELGNASFADDYSGGSGPHLIWRADGTHFQPAANTNYIAPAFVTAINSLLPRRVVAKAA